MNIYVGNLSLDITEDELRQEFVTFGQVTSVDVMNDKYIGSGQPRGYGFVVMTSKSEGEAAITGLAGKKLRGMMVSIVESRPLSARLAGSGSLSRIGRFSSTRHERRR